MTSKKFDLLEAAAHGATAGTNGDATFVGLFRRYAFICTFTAKATESSDTCDVYVDALVNGTWINAVHFTQALGNGTDAATEYAILDSVTPGTSIIVATSDAASTAVRPTLFSDVWRARYVIVDGGGTAAAFTFGVKGYAAQ